MQRASTRLGLRVEAGLPCVGGSSSVLLPPVVEAMPLGFLDMSLLRMRPRIGHGQGLSSRSMRRCPLV